MHFEKIESAILNDKKGIVTLISLASTIGIYANSTRLSSPYLGIGLTVVYFLINSTFTGNILFKDESTGFRFILGLLVLLMLIAIGGSAIIVAGALIPVRFSITTTTVLLALLAVAVSLLNRTRILARFLGPV